MASFDTENIRLTDFVDVGTLQEIQDSFAAVAGVKASIADAQGNLLTQPEPTADFLRRHAEFRREPMPEQIHLDRVDRQRVVHLYVIRLRR